MSKTAGDEPQSNGRAEVSVKVTKTMVRKALSQGGVGSKWWPWALRYTNEVFRCKRLHEKPTFPTFMQEVLIRKRRWKRGDFEPTMETVRYLYPSKENHGHYVVKDGETPRLTRCILEKVEDHPVEAHWIALERELLDGLTLRRRLREKTAVKKIQKQKGGQEEKEEEITRRANRVLEEEMRKALGDPPELAEVSRPLLTSLRKALHQSGMEEEEEVLQTRIVSPKEVAANWEAWVEASGDEVNSLINEKEALKPLTRDEVKKLKEEAERDGVLVELIPSKLVFTKKPGKRGGKKKVRWVVCGNYESRSPDEENFSSGADAAAFRIMVWLAMKFQWQGSILDVKTAFLNADMVQKEGEQILLVLPPSFFVERGFLEKETYYLPLKAVYGFRRSPRLWGEHRDQVLAEVEFPVRRDDGEVETLRLEALESEPNLWKIVVDGEEEGPLKGLLMTYVDDLFIAAPKPTVDALKLKIQEMWKTSDPEDVSSKPVKFLGMEVSKKKEADGREAWAISQVSYITDLLEGEELEKRRKKVPMSKDQATMQPDEVKPKAEEIKLSQKAVGEMLWLVTRTRLDLMFGVSRMGANVLKSTKMVREAAAQMKGYLWGTKDEGLVYREAGETEIQLNVFSDASFAPDAEESHGCFVVLLENSPIFWRSGRQGLVTLSTAEAEMNEMIEAMVAGESIGVIVEELLGFIPKVLWTDSMSGLAIVTNDGGSWRTRHLRTRSAFARQAVQQGLWSMAHVPGEEMLADLGTKPLAAPRLEGLKRKLRMGSLEEEVPKEEKRSEEKKKEEGTEDAEDEKRKRALKIQKASTVLKLIALMSAIPGTKSDDPEDGEKKSYGYHLEMMLLFYTVFIVAITSIMWWVLSRSEGPAGSGENFSTRRFNRRTLLGTYDEEEDAGSEEDEYGNVHDVPRPRGLSDQDWQGSAEACGSEAMWDLVARGKEQGGKRGKAEKGGGKKKAEEKGKGEGGKDIEGNEEQGKGSEGKEEDEEGGLLQASKRDRDHHQATDVIEEAADRLVLTTRYGRAHHGSYECDALVGREIRVNHWCPLCLRRTGPATAVTLTANSWGAHVHTNRLCERIAADARRYTPCLVCRRDG